jgi:hypothetical protein
MNYSYDPPCLVALLIYMNNNEISKLQPLKRKSEGWDMPTRLVKTKNHGYCDIFVEVYKIIFFGV